MSRSITVNLFATLFEKSLIYNRTKLMLLGISHINLKIINSHNFVQAPLSAFL